MKRCGGCGEQIRVGSMVYASDGAGGLVRKRVGKCCSSKAVPILIRPIIGARCACNAPATHCTACAIGRDKKDTKKLLERATKKLKSLVAAYVATGGRKDDEMQFQISGLEQAIDVLENGDF